MNSKDIAKLAGVSRSTVSRVINNYSNVPDETREKVLAVIKKYHYVPHASARALAGGVVKRIGLFVVGLNQDLDGKQILNSQYLSSLTSSMIDLSNKADYTVVVTIISSKRDYEKAFQLFYDQTISCGVFIGVRGDEEDIRDLITKGYKIAIIDQSPSEYEKIYRKSIIVNADNFNGAYEATKYLIQLGHKRIAHVTGGDKQLSTIERLEGYQKAFKDFGLEIDPRLIFHGDFTFNSGYKVTKEILKGDLPTAIFYASDSMAMGGIQAIEAKGLSIPNDISILGFDDIELAQFLRPKLTTVRIDLAEMVSVAFGGLMKMIEEEKMVTGIYTVPVKLMVRDSCKALTE